MTQPTDPNTPETTTSNPDTPRARASRQNGAKSRGPVTKAGKARSSLNAMRTGMFARTLVLPTENAERFKQLFTQLHAEYQPVNLVERHYVETMAAARWRQTRIWSLEKSLIAHRLQEDHSLGDHLDNATRTVLVQQREIVSSGALEVLQRSEMRLDRQYNRARKALLEAREARRRQALADAKLAALRKGAA
jgi:hypothetical protein